MTRVSRRELALAVASLPLGLGFTKRLAAAEAAGHAPGISRAAESIHQEIEFAATRARVYRALTDARQFDRVVHLSAAMRSGKVPDSVPTLISRRVGGRFALFGGYLTGVQLELAPVERIVQAWRAGSWDPGAYSVVSFTLSETAGGSRVRLDHRGFPDGAAEHLAQGWYENYWEPLAAFLAAARG